MPNYDILNPKTPRPEQAALELACLYDIDTIVICGHSDCKVIFSNFNFYIKSKSFKFLQIKFTNLNKAMNLVYENRNKISDSSSKSEKESVLKTWLMSNSSPTIKKFLELEKSNFKKPLNFSSKLQS